MRSRLLVDALRWKEAKMKWWVWVSACSRRRLVKRRSVSGEVWWNAVQFPACFFWRWWLKISWRVSCLAGEASTRLFLGETKRWHVLVWVIVDWASMWAFRVNFVWILCLEPFYRLFVFVFGLRSVLIIPDGKKKEKEGGKYIAHGIHIILPFFWFHPFTPLYSNNEL